MTKRARGVKRGVHNIAFWPNFAFEVDSEFWDLQDTSDFVVPLQNLWSHNKWPLLYHCLLNFWIWITFRFCSPLINRICVPITKFVVPLTKICSLTTNVIPLNQCIIICIPITKSVIPLTKFVVSLQMAVISLLNHSALSGSLFAVIFDLNLNFLTFLLSLLTFVFRLCSPEFKSYQSQLWDLILPSSNLITQKKKLRLPPKAENACPEAAWPLI